MIIPPGWDRLGFTSGRRTYLGNRRVGGVANSDHLKGTAADFTASPAALRARFGPNVNILDEGDHRHVSGLSDVPFHGNRGTAGLVNGVDTSAPKGQSMFAQRRNPPINPPQGPLYNAPLGTEPQQMMQSEPVSVPMDLTALAQLANPQKVKKGGLFGSGLSFGEALVHGLNGYLAGVGNPVGQANMEGFQRARIQEDERNFARERLQAEIEGRMQLAKQRAAEPPSFVRNAQAYASLDPSTQQQVADFYSVTNPQFTNIEQADGSVMRVPVSRGPQMGPQPGAEEDGYVFLGGDPADPKNWKAR